MYRVPRHPLLSRWSAAVVPVVPLESNQLIVKANDQPGRDHCAIKFPHLPRPAAWNGKRRRHGGHCDSGMGRGWNGAGVLFDGLREPVFCRFQDVLLLLLRADLFAFFSPRG
jgi:hypothetical protein